ncbi:elongator complex protein 6-like isoform X1 [Liolophura sinensis]|uniref:elongator complex protein 6-like isoform X1 n=1 Tax=Liolophura sinensis TaxID=3198878 RepID=UPI0031592C6B
MFPDINNFLDIKGNFDFAGDIIAISDSKTDGSFFIHHFLSLFLRQRRHVCFVGLQQSFTHYNSLSMKFGLNLNKLRETGDLTFIEGLKLIGESIISSKEESQISDEHSSPEQWTKSLVQDLSLKELFLHIQNLTSQVNKQAPVVIIDDICVLLNLGVSHKEIITFIHYLKSQIVFKKLGSVVVYLHGDEDAGDDEEGLIWKTMCHSCSVQLQVTGLPSGYCKEVHGEITLTCRKHNNCSSDERIKVMSKKIQYQTTDKNVVCFAVGMSSVVL